MENRLQETVVEVVEVKAIGLSTLAGLFALVVAAWVFYALARYIGYDEARSNVLAVLPSILVGFGTAAWRISRSIKVVIGPLQPKAFSRKWTKP